MSSILLSWIWQIRVLEAGLSLFNTLDLCFASLHWLPFNILYFWVSGFFNEPTFTVVRLLLHIHSDEWVLQTSAAKPNGVPSVLQVLASRSNWAHMGFVGCDVYPLSLNQGLENLTAGISLQAPAACQSQVPWTASLICSK